MTMCLKFGTSGIGVEVAVAVGDGVKVGGSEGSGEAVAEGSTAIGAEGEHAHKNNPANKMVKTQ
jgi:hypothetical protein